MPSSRNAELEGLKATLDWHPVAATENDKASESQGTGDIHDIIDPKPPVAKPRQGVTKPQTGDIHD